MSPRQPRVLTHTAFAVLSVGSCLFAYLLASSLARSLKGGPDKADVPPPATANQDVAGLRVPASALDVGEVWETEAFKIKLPLKNVTGRELHIADLDAGCACAEITPRAMTLRPGETVELKLTIDLTRRGHWERHESRRAMQIGMRPRLAGLPPPKEGWTLKGVVRSRITVEMDKLNFGDRTAAGVPAEPRHFEARLHGPSGLLRASVIPPEAGSVKVEALGGQRFSVAVSPAPSLPAGPFRFSVELTAEGEGEPAGVAYRVPVLGTMRPEVRAFPAQVFLGPRRVGTTAEAFVQLQSPPGAGWEVDRVECDSPDVKFIPVPGGYRVLLQVKRAGDRSAAVRFFVRKGKAAAEPVAVAITYYGQIVKEQP